MQVKLQKVKSLVGTVVPPGDKSISHRSAIISALSNGVCEIENFLFASDTESTLNCLKRLGVEVEISNGVLKISGKSLQNFSPPSSVLDAGNSGTTIRLLTGVLAGQSFISEITGDESLRRRPMKRIIIPLEKMGARIESTAEGTAPLKIYGVGKLNPIEHLLEIPSAQVKSCLIFAGLYADGKTKIFEPIPTRDHTERMLRLNVYFENGVRVIEVEGGMKIEPQKFFVPNDISSASFFIVAGAIIPNSEIVVKNVTLNPTRTGFIEVLKNMGANILIENFREINDEPVGDLVVRTGNEVCLKNLKLSGKIIPNIIDEIPILAVAGTMANGIFEVRDASDLRNKESDRIKAIVGNLRAMGVDVEEYDDGFAFEGGKKLKGAFIETFKDHRIAMAFSIAGLMADGETVINDAECVRISYPNFFEVLTSLFKQ